MKTIEYWHPKRGIGGPALEDSDHAFLYKVNKENDMEPIIGVITKFDEKRGFWVVRPLKPTGTAFYYVAPEDIAYRDAQVNDLVELRKNTSLEGSSYTAHRHGAKAQ